jgi:SAM-dependent methyltransferase
MIRASSWPAAAISLLLFWASAPLIAQVRMLASSPHSEDPLTEPAVTTPAQQTKPIRLTDLPSKAAGDAGFQPEVGQPGKDVIWIPTPDALVRAMLSVADVKPGDFLVDLGSGDGRIAIAAARDFGARSLGIEYNPDMVALARRNAQRAGVAARAVFREADLFETDFSDATVVTLYLLPSLNLRLRDTLLKMRPGTRILSNRFTMGEWEPERVINADQSVGYFWLVPANVTGRWAFEVGSQRFAVELGQKFQHLSLARGGPILAGQLKGSAITLVLADGTELAGEVNGNEMGGSGWMATRIRRPN